MISFNNKFIPLPKWIKYDKNKNKYVLIKSDKNDE